MGSFVKGILVVYRKGRSSDRGKGTPVKDKILLKFMQMSIEKINTCLINIHALQEVLIQKGILTQKELSLKVNEVKDLPQTKEGKNILEQMIKDFDVDKLTGMIDTDLIKKI